jgi:hypothetical protein
MAEKNDFKIKLVNRAEVPSPVTKALGTGTAASLTNLSITLPYVIEERQANPSVQQVVPQKDR